MPSTTFLGRSPFHEYLGRKNTGFRLCCVFLQLSKQCWWSWLLLIVRRTRASTLLWSCLASSCARTSCPCSRVARKSFKDSASCLVCCVCYRSLYVAVELPWFPKRECLGMNSVGLKWRKLLFFIFHATSFSPAAAAFLNPILIHRSIYVVPIASVGTILDLHHF